MTQVESKVDLITYDWTKAYEIWAKEVFHNPNSKTPNAQQRIALQAVHERQVNEFHDRHRLERPFPQYAEPLLHLVHGLPGAGKSDTLLLR